MKLKIIFLLIVVVILNGLNNSRELNDIAIVSSIAIDVTEDSMYEASAQVLNTKKTGTSSSSGGSSSDGAIINVYTNKGESVQEAIRGIIKESPKKLYLAHMKLLLLSEEVAKSNELLDTLDFFIRDNEGSNKFILAIAKDCKPKDIISELTPIQTMPSQNIISSISVANEYEGTASDAKFSDNMKVILEEGKDPTFVSIGLKGNVEEGKSEDSLKETTPSVNVEIKDLAYFNQGQMSGYLKGKDNMIYNLLENKVSRAIIRVGQKEDRIVAEIIDSKCKMTPEVENGVFKVNIDEKVKCNITELGINKKINTKEELEEVKKKINDEITNEINTYINNCKNVYKTDIIGFGNLFYRHKFKEYSKVIDNFEKDYFKNVEVSVNVESEFPDEGGIIKKW